MRDAVQHEFSEQVMRLGIHLSDQQLEQFEQYFTLLVEWNEKMNLTGITERSAVYEKHFYDSLTLIQAVDFNALFSLADIGSGAGFPSIPLAIAFPHLKVTIIDSLAKRIRFLDEVTSHLNLSGVSSLHSRAEDAARLKDHRDRYDIVTARAVARMAVLNEFCLPFVRVGGVFLAMKGSDIAEELEESRFSARILQGEIREIKQLHLPSEGSVRHLIVVEKLRATPASYPRKAGIPLKSPLIK